MPAVATVALVARSRSGSDLGGGSDIRSDTTASDAHYDPIVHTVGGNIGKAQKDHRAPRQGLGLVSAESIHI